MIVCANAAKHLHDLPAGSVHVAFADPPYGIQKSVSSVPKYDKSASIIAQKWTDFSAGWDVIQDYWQFTRDWLVPLHPALSSDGSLFITGTFHNIPIISLVLKEIGYHIVQWIAWCKPNSFPQREMIQQTSANEVVIHARKSSKVKHFYNVERAKDYAELDYVRQTGKLPKKKKPVNLRDYWPISNDSRAAKRWPFLIHGAKKPPELVARCIDISLPDQPDLIVLDPFLGSGTTGEVVWDLDDWTMTPRDHILTFIGIEIHDEYARMASLRLDEPIIWGDGHEQLDVADRYILQEKLGGWSDTILEGEELTGDQARIIDIARMKRYYLTVPKVLQEQYHEKHQPGRPVRSAEAAASPQPAWSEADWAE